MNGTKKGEDHTIPGLMYRYVEKDDFFRIREFFTGDESTGDRVYLRSRPEEREGYYWIVPLRMIHNYADIHKVHIQVQVPNEIDLYTKTFTINDLDKNKRYLWIGLTGEDWPGARRKPIAWSLRLEDREDQEIAQHKSFLWNR